MKNGQKLLLMSLLGLILILALSCNNNVTIVGSDVDNTDYIAEADFHHDIALTSQTRLRLLGISGDITITGRADFDSVIVDGTRQVGSDSQEDADEHLPLLTVEVQTSSDQIAIETHQPDESHGRSYIVDYVIIVPDDFLLTVSNVNGIVETDSIDSNIIISNVNGLVNLDDITGSVTVSLVNGLIDATIVLPAGGTIALSNVNGNIVLNIPTETSAEFGADVVNGTISLNGLDLHDEEITNQSVDGILGDGDGTIGLSTVNGNIAASGF
jgi:hypothetical protein